MVSCSDILVCLHTNTDKEFLGIPEVRQRVYDALRCSHIINISKVTAIEQVHYTILWKCTTLLKDSRASRADILRDIQLLINSSLCARTVLSPPGAGCQLASPTHRLPSPLHHPSPEVTAQRSSVQFMLYLEGLSSDPKFSALPSWPVAPSALLKQWPLAHCCHTISLLSSFPQSSNGCTPPRLILTDSRSTTNMKNAPIVSTHIKLNDPCLHHLTSRHSTRYISHPQPRVSATFLRKMLSYCPHPVSVSPASSPD